MKSLLSCLFVFSLMLLPCSTHAKDWRGFRGYEGNGSATGETNLPLKWSDKENIDWRAELPGAGTSSPIVVDDKIFLTSYTGYAMKRDEPGEMTDLMRHVVCLNRKNGKVVWTKKFKPQLPESKYSGGNNSWHGYASSTIASDGERLYVFFGKSGVYCLTLKGDEVWHVNVGDKTRGWGSSNSPVLYKNMVIINASIENSSMVALNKMTGKEIWTARGIKGAWNTPHLVSLLNGKSELVLSLPGRPIGHIVGYDPENGKELWRSEGIPDKGYICPSVISHKEVIYAIGGRKNTAVAIKAGGRGDVTKTHQLWTVARGSNVTSPVYYDGHLFWFHERRGVAYSVNVKTGKLVYEERIQPRPGIIYSSMLVADGKLYMVSQHNGTYVLKANAKFKLLAHNTFGKDDSRTNSSPVVSDGQLLMRNDKYLYCIGKK